MHHKSLLPFQAQMVPWTGSFKYAESSGSFSSTSPTSSQSGTNGASDWKAQKEAQAQKRKVEAALKKCEDEIAKLEARDSEINELLADPAVGTDLAKLRKLTDEQTEIQDRLAELYDEWESLSM